MTSDCRALAALFTETRDPRAASTLEPAAEESEGTLRERWTFPRSKKQPHKESRVRREGQEEKGGKIFREAC